MLRALVLVSWLVATALSGSCAYGSYGETALGDEVQPEAAAMDGYAGAVANDLPGASYLFRKSGDEQKGGPRNDSPAPIDRLLVYRGRVRVEVTTPEESARAFLQKVREWGGHLAQQTGATFVVRVPAASFDEAYAWLCAQGRVLDEQREASDVTDEFVDLGIRIDNCRRARDRLLEVLQKATAVEDILKVEAELRRVTEELERMEGRKKLLADQVAMATLEGSFAPKSEPPPARRKPRQSRYAWIRAAGPEGLLGGN